MKLDFNAMREITIPALNGGEGAVSARMFMDASCKAMMSRLPVGASIGYHEHKTSSEFNYIISGSCKAVCDGAEEVLCVGDCQYCKKGSSHSLLNSGDCELVLFTVVTEDKMKLELRNFRDNDIPMFADWLKKPHVAAWYHHPAAWLDEVSKRADEYSWITHFIITADGSDIGFCQFYPYDKSGEDWQGSVSLNGTYSLDYMIGEERYLKRGCGREALLMMTKLIGALPDAERIIVQPEPENAASCRTLLSAGYTFDEENGLYIRKLK